MPEAPRLFTPTEAAAVTGLPLEAVNHVIDNRIVPVATQAGAGKRSARRCLTSEDLVRLRVEHDLPDRLPVEMRQGLFRELSETPDAVPLKADDLTIADIVAARRQVAARIRDLEEAEAAIHQDKDVMGGEAVFKGTRIPVHGLVAMLGAGATEAELLEGRPRLSRRLLDLARLWVIAHPRRRRPRSLAAQGFTLISTTRHTLRADPLAVKEPSAEVSRAQTGT